jgi:hypothetical protein
MGAFDITDVPLAPYSVLQICRNRLSELSGRFSGGDETLVSDSHHFQFQEHAFHLTYLNLKLVKHDAARGQ